VARHAIIVSICFLATACFAQEKYHNSKWHFSLVVPEGWEKVKEDQLRGKYCEVVIRLLAIEETWHGFIKPRAKRDTTDKEKEDDKPKLDSRKTMAILQKTDAADEKTAFMIVQCETIGNPHGTYTAEYIREQSLLSDLYREVCFERLESFEDAFIEYDQSDKWRRSKYNRGVFYNKDKRAFHEKTILSGSGDKTAVVSRVRILGSNRITTLMCHSYNEEPENFIELLKQTVDSFSYDRKYGYSEAPATIQIKTLLHWLAPAVPVLILLLAIYKGSYR